TFLRGAFLRTAFLWAAFLWAAFLRIPGLGCGGRVLLRVVVDVEARSLELDSGRRHQLVDLRPALRARVDQGIRKLLDDLEPVPAAVTFVLVKRHWPFGN